MTAPGVWRPASVLTRERLVSYAWIAAICVGAGGDVLALAAQFNAGPQSFLAFQAAGSLALKGQAAAAYDWVRHAAEAQALMPGAPAPDTGLLYPPLLLLLLAPLAVLPLSAAAAAWTLATLAGYVAAIRAAAPERGVIAMALVFTGVFQNLWWNQTGFLSAALLGGGVLLLDRRALLAGGLLAALAYKPQLALLLPFALVAGGNWRAVAGAAMALAALVAATLLLFGGDAWLAFAHSLSATREHLLAQADPAFGISVFSLAKLWGAGAPVAGTLQAVVSLGAVAVVAWAWRGPGPTLLKGAVLAALVPLASPYLHPYDLLVLGMPIAVLIREGRRHGFLPWDHAVLIAAFVLPAFVIAASGRGVPLLPLVTSALALVLLRRLRQDRAPQ